MIDRRHRLSTRLRRISHRLRRAVVSGAGVSIVLAGAAVGAAGMRAAQSDGAAGSTATHQEARPIDASGIDRAALDPSVGACDDFYQHACGGFIAAAHPGPTTPVVDMTAQQFDANLDRNLAQLFAKDIHNDPELDRLKTFFQSCRTAGAADQTDIKSWLGRIDAATTPGDLQKMFRALSQIGVDVFFTYSGRPDRTNWQHYHGEIDNADLWADRAVVARTFTAAGEPAGDAERDAASVAEMVTALSAKSGDRWDAKTAENPRSLRELQQLAPAIDWPAYFTMVHASPDRRVNVTSPAYLQEVERQLTTRSPAELRAFARWMFLFSLRGEVPAPYNAAFGDIGPRLRVKISDRAGYCRDATVRAMGVEFSRQYAEHILGWKARAAAQRIATDIKRGIVASVADDHWLSAPARKATAQKLAATDLKIGFPDHWPAVGTYPLHADRFFDNVLAAREFEQERNWARANQPRSRQAWDMIVSPWVGDGMAAARLVVPNGFPDAFSNSLIMTAAFLSRPRFDASASLELNYATFGAVFAHEFVHVAESHMFSADGRDAELWSDRDKTAAAKQDQCVIDQASAFAPAPGVKMPGAKQFDENVADYGGLRLAYTALERRLGTALYKRDATGTSPAQRFFYRYAQYHCVAQTPENLRQSVAGDSHAPPSFRVNGPVSNVPGFGRAFGCHPGAAMVRTARNVCRVW